MTIPDLVRGANLNGDDFNLGTDVPNNITINVDGATVIRGAGGLSSPDQVASYSNATQELTISRNDGSPDDVLDMSALAADIFVDGATFDATTGVLTLTDTGNGSAATPDVVVDLSALLGVSADAGNLLSDGTDGKPLLTSVVSTDAGNLVSTGADGLAVVTSADICATVINDCTDPCPLTDVFGATIGTLLMQP